MKIKKAVLKAVSVGALVGIAATSCKKEILENPVQSALEKLEIKKGSPTQTCYDCPACGMG